MEVNGVAVMRRRSDSWLNATQVLKVAGVEKGKRTKVLEKEILAGEHEKVQGGYGRYQGTWINYHRGVEFARQYGVEEMLRPLFEYDMGQDGMSIAGQGDLHTPTKEQAMAAARKRNMINGGLDSRPPAQSPNGTFFKNISKSAANAVSAMNKARFESPSRSGMNGRPAKLDRRSSQQMMGSQDSAYVGSSQQSNQSLHSEPSFGPHSQLDSTFRSFENASSNPFDDNADAQEPPRKRPRQETSNYQDTAPFDTSMHDAGDMELISLPHTDVGLLGLQPLPQPASHPAIEKQQLLTSLFMDVNQTDFTNHPALVRLSGEDLDIPIDATAHTALHWAASLARTSLLRALIAKGASIYRLNGGGETALMRAALTTNNLDQGSFPELLDLLGPTIEIRDSRARTVLHHIAVSSAVKGRGPASRYYLESLLEFVVRQGSAPSSQQVSFQGNHGVTAPRSIGLARFMSEIVNAADISGDTALNLATKIGDKSIIQQLLEVGADPTIPNRGGLKPVDFGVGGELPDATEREAGNQIGKPQRSAASKVSESSQDLLSCKRPSNFCFCQETDNFIPFKALTTLLSDTESSFRAEAQKKQSLVDQGHTKLREATSQLNEDRKRLSELTQDAEHRKALRQRIANLQNANETQRSAILSIMPGDRSTIDKNVQVGEADAGLEVEEIGIQSPENQSINSLSSSQQYYLSSLPSAAILRARISAYNSLNEHMEQQTKGLQGQSSILETQLRKIVSLCTAVSESKVDGMLEGLVQAVESERGDDVEVGRVREFLRRVESVE